MESRKPEVYIEKRNEIKKGFKYEQPVKYCDGREVTFAVIQEFKEIFGVEFHVANRESYVYNISLEDSLYNSKIWTDNKAKDKAFEFIHNFNLGGKSGSGSSTTPLMPFEIFLMNDGFEMIHFIELNALNPMSRKYRKGLKIISLSFGIRTMEGNHTNFYFQIFHVTEDDDSRYILNGKYFQVDNRSENYKKAISGKLKTL